MKSKARGVDIIFAPKADEMYGFGFPKFLKVIFLIDYAGKVGGHLTRLQSAQNCLIFVSLTSFHGQKMLNKWQS